MKNIPEGWEHIDNTLQKKFVFKNFNAALEVIMKIGFEAEYLNHHPEWTNVYNKLSIKLTTHDAGNTVTEKDIELATRINVITNK
jgi:4a-hydroxytetrahydrobiopterin dehydratase